MLTRISVLCGSAAPFACGVLDYSDRLNVEFKGRGLQVQAVHEPLTLSGMSAILGKLKGARPDVLLMHYPNAAYGYSLAPHLLANVAGRVPFILTLHEFEPAHPLRKLSVSLLTSARAIIVTNQLDRGRLLKWYPWVSKRVKVVPLASNIAGKPWAPVAPFTVAHFGLFRPGKGLEEFLECARLVRARTAHIRFRVIGALTGGAADYGKAILEQARNLGMDVLVGASEQQVATALATASIAYLPFPDGASARRGSILAAASCGLPLLSTTGEGTGPELAAALIAARSPADAAEQLLSLLENPTCLQDAHVRSAGLGASFTWENVAQRYMDVFDVARAVQ